MQTRDTDLLACARTRVSRSTQVSHFDVLCCAEFCERPLCALFAEGTMGDQNHDLRVHELYPCWNRLSYEVRLAHRPLHLLQKKNSFDIRGRKTKIRVTSAKKMNKF